MWLIVTGSAVAAADTISAPWTPTSSGPPPDANGSGSDTKNLDVGEISDVSSISLPIIIQLILLSQIIFFNQLQRTLLRRTPS